MRSRQKPINVELQINKCLTEEMGAEPLAFNKGGQQELTTYIKHQSLGMPVEIDLSEGEMQSWWEEGQGCLLHPHGSVEPCLRQLSRSGDGQDDPRRPF